MNHLYYGDNLRILREHIKDESVDLVYLDPAFNSQANYNATTFFLTRPPANNLRPRLKHSRTLGTGMTRLKLLSMK
jgi:16S rRNA G966 N2-methylase RsmD